ncbi:zinc-ribbon domain-containing protein [Curtobacterium caseinilyticum]|uniref:FHA domain-containing protein n=1 Tax=Curtobacterium caseinilyticum TaxID=3055137 RepID=A0ABT7TNC4_9MICO|nr:zinc-ribbon domain-containing protein [Curtobacterium caseinilyticum]MDM7890369.1 FHA domain-containing protein [Curtobacterium caseinilyticum]
MIRCEHCGSTLPDGAIFCGECGRSVNVSANRRPAPPAPLDDTPPPPLQQPDQHGRHPDPAAEAWLPEATLDPATRAWLTGADRQRDTGPVVPVDRPSAPTPAPLQAPEHVNGAVPGVRDWADVGRPDVDRVREPDPAAPLQAEPSLDPDAQPVTPGAPVIDGEVEDPEHTRVAPPRDDPRPVDDASAAASARTGAWAPPTQQPPAAPSRPSWWVGRGTAPAEPPVVDQDEGGAPGPEQQARPGDTAVVEPLVDRRPAPTPLVAPGSGPATCPVCGHTLEPDDIFCAECGAVRPAVTAAFTGPVVPLPMARPDWAADDQLPTLDQQGPDQEDGDQQGPDQQDGDQQDGGEQPDAQRADDRPVGDAGDGSPSDTDDASGDSAAATDDAPVGPAASAGSAAPAVAEPVGQARHAAPDGLTDSPPVQVPEDTPRTPIRPRGAHADADDAVDRASSVPSAPMSPTVPSTAPLPDLGALPPTVAPLPPLPGTTAPVLPPAGGGQPPSSGETDDDEDVEETRIVTKTTSDAPFVLHFSTGERSAVHGTGLLGRLPRPQPGERFDDLLTVHDPGKSVSKTHLELGRDGDDLWVSDRFSGNGTVVRHIDGSIRRCEPGRRYRVERGARVDIGEQFFLVQ